MTTALDVRPRRPQIVVTNDADATAIGDLYRKGGRTAIEAVQYWQECGQKLKAKQRTMSHGA